MKLGGRLACAASFVRPGTVIDIGSDHAYLPAYLIRDGICPSAAASDINEMPLERAKVTALRYGVAGRMEFYLSDGFEKINKTYDTACICGMGGQLIADIIEKGKGKFTCLVLQPMTKAEELRGYLWNNGYLIEAEAYPTEMKKPYVVISSYHTGKITPYTYTDTFLGKVRPDTDGYRLYVEKVYLAASKRYGGTKKPEDGELIRECRTILKNI